MVSTACMEEDKYVKNVFHPGPFLYGIISFLLVNSPYILILVWVP